MAHADKRIEIINLNNRPAAEIRALLRPFLEDGEVIRGDGFQLILKASPKRLTTLSHLVEQLDRRLRNLTISVLQNSHKSAAQLNAEHFDSAAANRMHGISGDTRNLASQRDMQQLRVLEGRTAVIKTGQSRPIDSLRLNSSLYGQPNVISQQALREASTGFTVIPHLQNNNQVRIDLMPWSEQWRGNHQIDSRGMQTSITVKLGEWQEIGGLGNAGLSKRHGLNGLNYTTQDQQTRTLIKIDLAD